MKVVLENIIKKFGDKTALKIDNYIVNSGEIVGLVGNNGAGKTTMFRVLLDLLKPDEGHASINDIITNKSEEWKSFTGAFIDSSFLIDYLTPEEYFSFIGKISGMNVSEISNSLEKFETFMNGEIMGNNTLIRNLSAGNKQKVGIIGAMITNPDILILDEYNKECGATIIVSSHNLSHTLDICNRVTLLEHGCIIKDYNKEYSGMIDEIENYFQETLKH